MRLPRRISEPGFVVSALVHAGVLGATLVAFSHAQKFDDVQETVPVEMVTDSQFNQIMKGDKDAKEVKPDALAKAETVAPETEPKPAQQVPDQTHDATPPPPPPPPPPARVEAQPEPPTPTPPPPPPPPVPTPPERPEPPQPEAKAPPIPTPPVRDVEAEPLPPKPVPKPVPKPPVQKPPPLPPIVKQQDAKPPAPKPRPADKPDRKQLAKLLEDDATDDTPPTPKPSRVKVKPARQPSEDSQSKFDPTDISRLLDHEAPAQKPSAGRAVSHQASLGAPNANAAKMAPSLWGALDGLLEDQYRQCWSYLGLASGEKYIPQVRVVYAPDGSLESGPVLVNPPSDPSLQSLADSALRAVRRCNPLKIPEQFAPYYDQWKGRVLRFDPEEMAG